MFSTLANWLRKRRELRKLWQIDAQLLIDSDELSAYYAAHRLAARSRAIGDRHGFFHWSKVAAEVARRSSVAEMDFDIVKAIAQSELDGSEAPN